MSCCSKGLPFLNFILFIKMSQRVVTQTSFSLHVKIHQDLSRLLPSNYNLFDVQPPSLQQPLTHLCSYMHICVLSCLNSDPESGDAKYVPNFTYVRRSRIEHMAMQFLCKIKNAIQQIY